MATTYLMLLWHQHQPFYKDLVENRYTMPWVRLHALKDYHGMVAELRAFPAVHVTFNLVPSLIAQLEDYANDRAQEESFEIAFKPAGDLSPNERERLLYFTFQVNFDNLLNRYPRFRELHEKANPAVLGSRLAPAFTESELRDLQVLSQLAWFEQTWFEFDAEIRHLTMKGRGFSEDDKLRLRSKELKLVQAVLEEHRQAAQRGQIEISTSPFYHPILPLLCDTNIARESHPGVPLPRRRFHHPEDARDQLRAAVRQHERVFGTKPSGLWPSEGSVSEEALTIAATEGFVWAASDEGVLSRSLGIGFTRRGDGTMSSGELYRPQRLETSAGPITLFFRDHEISDLIGFVYSSVPPEKAAASLLERIRQAGRSTGGRPAVVSVILDGENAWEFYPENGRPFLRAFYRLLADDREIRAVTASEAMQRCELGTLPRLVPGSWINADFDVWIGAEEDNRAWDLLSDARDFLALHSAKPGVGTQAVDLARQELWIAEGSDWCWWYGPEHSTANDEEFDWLYRKHLGNIYGLLGASPPDSLAVPLKRPRGEALNVPPSGEIRGTIDGLITNYFEWLGAGVYCPPARSGSMHGPPPPVDAVHYGYDSEAFYVRVDFNRVFLQSNAHSELRVALQGSRLVRAQAEIVHGELHNPRYWRDDAAIENAAGSVAMALGRICELKLARPLAALADRTGRLQITVWENSVPVQVIPQEGWLTFRTEIEQVDW